MYKNEKVYNIMSLEYYTHMLDGIYFLTIWFNSAYFLQSASYFFFTPYKNKFD